MLYAMIQRICVHGCARKDDWLQSQSSEFSDSSGGLQTFLTPDDSLPSNQAQAPKSFLPDWDTITMEPEPFRTKTEDYALAKVPQFVTSIKPASPVAEQEEIGVKRSYSTKKSKEGRSVETTREQQNCQLGTDKEETRVSLPEGRKKYSGSFFAVFRKRGNSKRG